MQLEVILAGNRKAETKKESIKTKTESENCFCISVVQSIKLRYIVMSTNLEYRARERQRKRESGRQASEAQREKGRQGFRARDKKPKETFFLLEEQHENFVAAVTK